MEEMKTKSDLAINRFIILAWLEASNLISEISRHKKPNKIYLNRLIFLLNFLRNALIPYFPYYKQLKEIVNEKNYQQKYEYLSMLLYKKGFIKTDIIPDKKVIDLDEVLPKILKQIIIDLAHEGVDLREFFNIKEEKNEVEEKNESNLSAN